MHTSHCTWNPIWETKQHSRAQYSTVDLQAALCLYCSYHTAPIQIPVPQSGMTMVDLPYLKFTSPSATTSSISYHIILFFCFLFFLPFFLPFPTFAFSFFVSEWSKKRRFFFFSPHLKFTVNLINPRREFWTSGYRTVGFCLLVLY